MKYSHDWLTVYNSLPYYLQKRCINYKKWKKNKNTDVNYVKSLLNTEYNYIDKFIHTIYEDDCDCSCVPFLKPKYNDSDIYKFLILNKECLRKLTKRLDKKNGNNIMSKWYSVKLNQSGFISGFHIERLRLKLYGIGIDDNECPICFESFKDKLCIFDCGHRVCEPCVRELYNVKHLRGSIDALASYKLYHDNKNIPPCPVCRYRYPIRFASRCHVVEI